MNNLKELTWNHHKNAERQEFVKELMSGKITKEDVNRSYIKIQKKIHPDISPETSRLSSIVNEAKEIVLKDLS